MFGRNMLRKVAVTEKQACRSGKQVTIRMRVFLTRCLPRKEAGGLRKSDVQEHQLQKGMQTSRSGKM